MFDTVFVVNWRYCDGSASGTVRVYKNKSSAERDLEMLNKYLEGRLFSMEEVDFTLEQ